MDNIVMSSDFCEKLAFFINKFKHLSIERMYRREAIKKNITVRGIIFFITFLIFVRCETNVYNRTEKNYGKDIDRLAAEFGLPGEFLKALVILESSGRKEVAPRFEKHVFERLKKLRDGKLNRYENLRAHHIKDASDEALRNLASSWGPFQLMGYKCIGLNIKVSDLRGESALYWAIYWIDKEYGDYLRKSKFEEAFRIHNSGSPKGKTHDPMYVKNGITYMNYFKGRKQDFRKNK